MTQLNLSDSARARATDPATSHEAAASVSWSAKADSQRVVLAALKVAGEPITDEQIISRAIAHFSPSRLRTARAELVAAGVVVQAGFGVTSRGRKCAKWRLK